MTIENRFELWELGTLFSRFFDEIGDNRFVGSDPIPLDALSGLKSGRALIHRSAKGKAPTGLVTWSKENDEWWIDFIFCFKEHKSTARKNQKVTGRPDNHVTNKACGTELFEVLMNLFQKDFSARIIKCDFVRQLVASDYDFFSPLAEKYGMSRTDELLLSRPKGKSISKYELPAGYRFGTFGDEHLDNAVSVMVLSPDPSRLTDWSEQLCRDEILWSASCSLSKTNSGQGVSVWHEGRMVAFALATDTGLISQVHVLPECQNKGVGSALFSRLLSKIIQSGVKDVTVLAGDTNGEMLRLAERFDFMTALKYPFWILEKGR